MRQHVHQMLRKPKVGDLVFRSKVQPARDPWREIVAISRTPGPRGFWYVLLKGRTNWCWIRQDTDPNGTSPYWLEHV